MSQWPSGRLTPVTACHSGLAAGWSMAIIRPFVGLLVFVPASFLFSLILSPRVHLFPIVAGRELLPGPFVPPFTQSEV